jgi:Tol biopolymer transport system component/C-terminal processing protease CtpA/Prc
MPHSRLFVAALCVLAAGAAPAMQPQQRPAPAPLPSFGEPALSPDRREIAFSSGSDIWTVPAQGGEARLLVSHEANESRPLYSPDGQRLAFVSDRTGGGDIYVLTLATGTLQQITFDDGLDRLDAWSRDSQWLYFSSTARDVASMNDILRVRATGGTPASVSAERYTSEFFAAPAADGRRLAFTARGVSAAQWWRRGRSHLDESEIWLLHDDPATPRYEQLTERGAKQMWPMWSGDGRALYFVSDRGGTQNLWLLPLGGAAREITHFKSGRVLWPSISYDGREIVFERNFEIWKLDTASGRAAKVDIVKRGAPAAPALAHVSLAGRFQQLVLSPDGRKVAFLARGDVWAAGARDGGDAVRVTRTYAEEGQVAWTPDSRRLIYTSERDGTNHLFTYDFTNGEETQLTNAATRDAAPVVAPDGKTLAFIRDEKELRVLDLSSKQERTLAKGHLTTGSRSLAWSPDSKWIAYVGVSASSFLNLFAVPAAGGDARPLTAMPNGNSNNLSWSPDGTFIIFNTSQRTEQGEAVRVDLLLRTPQFREDRFRDLFRNDTPRRPAERPADQAPQSAPAPQPTPTPQPASAPAETPSPRDPAKPVEIVFEGIRRRASILPVGVDVISQAISPDGKSLLLTATAEGQQNLYIYSLDELAREPAVARQLTSTPGPKISAQFTPDSKDVFYLEQGRITSINLETRQPRPVAVTAETDVDFSAEKNEIFRQAWTYMRDGFYDDKFHGVDWEAVRTTYAPRIAGAQTPDEMRRLLNLMVGELNASHMGVAAGPRPPGSAEPPSSARLGLRFDRVELEEHGRFKVSEVIALGPAAVTRGIAVGDYVTRIDGTPLGRNTSVDEIMIHAVNRRVALQVSKAADGSGAREVAVQPVTMAAEKSLLYLQWVEASRAYVDKVSGGRLGYAHMLDMSEPSLRRLYMDLDADNRVRDGVVIDLRNNNGGFVNAYALDVLARRGYMNMTPRGFPTAPARTMLGQRALELPTILVTNQHSLSDAEDFTEGYRALKLGKVVGEPTAGWIIYTGSATLVDGSTMRMPRVRITTNEGKTMELNPRPVDVAVTRPIGESLSGKDSQLDRAVQELLAQLGGSRRTSEPR